MSPSVIRMREVATDYCNLIERADITNSKWLEDMANILPQLHVAVSALGKADYSDHSMTPDLDARFELFAELREVLGSKDGYWMQYDAANDGHCMTGSLADDLTDIYCELKHGLKLMEHEPARALDDWRNGFHVHWGQHLVDAERHLYELRSRNQL